MKNTKKILSKIYYLSLWAILFSPLVAFAWKPGDSIVPECNTVSSNGSITYDGMCHFPDLITLIDNLLDVFIWATVPLATILFAWIGWIFVTESDKAGARNKAKAKLMSLLKGMFFVLAAWVIVKVIVSGFGVKDSFNLFNIK